MIIVLLVIIWNSTLLWFTGGVIAYWLLPHFGIAASFLDVGIGSCAFVVAMAVLAASPIGDAILKLPLSLRAPIDRERKRIAPVLKLVTDKVQAKLSRNIACEIFITEVTYPYIRTLGRKTIILPRQLLEALTDEALEAGISSAMGRLYHRNSIYYSMALGACVFGNVIQSVLRWIATTITKIAYRHVWLLPIGFLGSLLAFILKGLQVVSVLLLKSYMRGCIYKADQLTKTLGLQDSFVAYLEVLAELEERNDGFFQKYSELFPSAMQRIGRLEAS